MNLALTAAAVLVIVIGVAAATLPLVAWVDSRTEDITATRSRVNSSVQAVVTTAAFALAYATYPEEVPALAVAAGIAVLFGLALGGELQAERLHRRALV